MDERELLARLIQCEAGGEGEYGMQAVATVIMNRVRAIEGEFARVSKGGDVRSIILQPEQFVCAMEVVDGQYNPQNIYNMSPEQIHYDIADWALAGNVLPEVAESLFFYSPNETEICELYFPTQVGGFHTQIGGHCFYYPTDLYEET